MRAYRFDHGTALVTGAASGIGEALAFALAARGSDLVLLDRHARRLAEVAAAVRAASPAVAVSTYVVDLADLAAAGETAARVAAEHPRTTLVVNNAGVALRGRFDQLTVEEFDWVITVNFRATVVLTHHLLPVLTRHRGAHLVNVSSVFGIVAPAGQTAYAASKFAVRGFSEALRQELAGAGVGVTVVHPGGINTRIALDARKAAGAEDADSDWQRLLTIAPADAARAILRGVERRRPRVLIGGSARALDLAARLLPGSHGRLLALGSR